jgi:exoribonuclease II
MNIFFEESGSFKAGSILSRPGNAFQVELPDGRRAKVKEKNVLLEFCAPTPAEFMQTANTCAQEIDPAFLWECTGMDEFSFTALADEYFGLKATPVQQAALILQFAQAPIYFRRKGRGQYQRAPADQVQAALAALARRQQQAALQAAYEEALIANAWPEAFKDKAITWLMRPDKNAIEYKALISAAQTRGISIAQLMLNCGAIRCVRSLHEACFRAEYFPKGTTCAPVTLHADTTHHALPVSEVEAFSVDDVTTTEIDDAFSIQTLPDHRLRIGIHIAIPALGIAQGSDIDLQARSRLSTVYAPGDKITMLPGSIIEAFTLKEGGLRPALSLYLIVDPSTWEIITSETRMERVFVAHNLRHNLLDGIITQEAIAAGDGDYPYRDEIAMLWPFAQALYNKRQQVRLSSGLKRETARPCDFNFVIAGEQVQITPRRRDAPLDLIVAELAILANSLWGGVLAEYGVPGIYRVYRTNRLNRMQMQPTPAPHEGLGVTQYAWSTSPLRRYTDLVNQRQLLACVQNGVTAKLSAPFRPDDPDLYAVIQEFDTVYPAYLDYQRRMERFWCLRWLGQEKCSRVTATLVKGDSVRLDDIPLLLHIPRLGLHARGTRFLLDIISIDELSLEASCRLVQVLASDTIPKKGADE